MTNYTWGWEPTFRNRTRDMGMGPKLHSWDSTWRIGINDRRMGHNTWEGDHTEIGPNTEIKPRTQEWDLTLRSSVTQMEWDPTHRNTH